MGWGEGSSVYRELSFWNRQSSPHCRHLPAPHSVALSPNAILFCMVSPSTVSTSRLSIHAMPKKTLKDVTGTHFHFTISFQCLPHIVLEHRAVSDLASVLVSAIRFKRTISDIAHQLSLSSISAQEVENVLYNVLEALETQDDGLRDVWVQEFFGILVEVYRYDYLLQRVYESNSGRSKCDRAQKALEKENLRIRWKTMLDLCSVIACHSAFEDCMDGDSIGLGMCHHRRFFLGSLSPKTISGH